MSDDNNKRSFYARSLIIGAAGGGFALGLLFNALSAPSSSSVPQKEASGVPYTSVLAMARDHEIGSISVVPEAGGTVVSGYNQKAGAGFKTWIPSTDYTALEQFRRSGVEVYATPPAPASSSFLRDMFMNMLPVLLIGGIMIYAMQKNTRGGPGGGATAFGKSTAKLTEMKGRVTFDDVAGIDEAKQDLQEIVEFLKDPVKFQRLGARIPKGVLLSGAPGTGKTLTARAVAGEAGVPFFTVSGSNFVEMFVGVGASRVRDMFDQAKKNAPCIIFIDEIDAIGRHRSNGVGGGGNDEREQTLNQLLVEMDGFEKTDSVIIMGATNRPDILDSALKRPGRFDRQVVVPLPDIGGREKILKVHMRNVPIASDVDPKIIARGTPGMSGADLSNLVNEAALIAAHRNRRMVIMADFEEAKDKVLMGRERRSAVLSEEEKLLVAYHEGGHAITAIHEKHSHPIHKATIIPRGNAGGYVIRLPEGDGGSRYIRQLKADLVVAAGGRVAEEIVFGKDNISIGASGDIDMATKVANAMVRHYGSSETLGFLNHGDNTVISEETQRQIDREIKALADDAYQRARDVITTHRDQLENIVQALLEYETLTGAEIKLAAEQGKEAVGAFRLAKVVSGRQASPVVPSIPMPPPSSGVPPSGPAQDNI